MALQLESGHLLLSAEERHLYSVAAKSLHQSGWTELELHAPLSELEYFCLFLRHALLTGDTATVDAALGWIEARERRPS
jgi:hypothetical protein